MKRLGLGANTSLNTSAVILAGGLSSRLGQDKGLLRLAGKPLIRYVLDGVRNIVDQTVIVVSGQEQIRRYSAVLGAAAEIVSDAGTLRSPLAGAVSGFEQAKSEYSLLLPCDTPFVSRDVLSLLLELCVGRNACVPRWPNGYIEPLQAAYRREAFLKGSHEALSVCALNIQSLIERLTCIRYVSTLVLKEIDPELRTFLNINTPLELRSAEKALKHEWHEKSKDAKKTGFLP